MMKQILLIELNFIFNAQTGWSVTNWLFITSCEGVGLKHIIRLLKVAQNSLQHLDFDELL